MTYGGDVINAAGDSLGNLVGASGAANQALPYLNIANDLVQGNTTGFNILVGNTDDHEKNHAWL